MSLIQLLLLFVCVTLCISCARSDAPKANTHEPTLEQGVSELEHIGNSNAPRFTQGELRKQYQADLVELQRLGFAERAQQDFSDRLPTATVTKWSMRYFMDTNTVWCDVRYTLSGTEEILQKEFGYTRRIGTKLGTNWNLIWEPEPKR